MSIQPFTVRGGLANSHVQSVLASSHMRRRLIEKRRPAVITTARPMILDCGEGVRLQGEYSPALEAARGLVVLLHGWEGSARSTYVLDAARAVHQAGFAVFRLNFRDHGDTHHLNTDLFHSCRIDEVVGAIGAINRHFDGLPMVLGGFSLGANFALRVALRAPAHGISLNHVIAVSPVICPPAGLTAIEDAPWIYEFYFLRKWRRSLRHKQNVHPGLYDLRPWIGGTLRQMTGAMVEALTDFATVEDYLDGYSLVGDRLSPLEIPATIVTAIDDPVIPVAHFHQLKLPRETELLITDHGGHCGFILDWRLNSWISALMVDRFGDACQGETAGIQQKETVSC